MNNTEASFKEIYSILKDKFDEKYYASTYPDLASKGIDLLEHYIIHGWKEGRNPTPDFNSNFYLGTYKDVKETLINPFYHYIKWGKSEKRFPKESEHKQNESQLMFYCARTKIDTATTTTIKELAKTDLDWSYFIRLVAENGVAPLVYKNLLDICPDIIPTHILTKLHNDFQSIVAKNKNSLTLLLNLLELL